MNVGAMEDQYYEIVDKFITLGLLDERSSYATAPEDIRLSCLESIQLIFGVGMAGEEVYAPLTTLKATMVALLESLRTTIAYIADEGGFTDPTEVEATLRVIYPTASFAKMMYEGCDDVIARMKREAGG